MASTQIKHRIQEQGAPLRLKAEDKERLKLLFLAKHAKAKGEFHHTDGIHSTYHNEIRECLLSLGLNVSLANDYAELFQKPEQNFIFTLYNRGQFRNSEIFASCLSEYHSLPYLGAPPSMRGFSDDKHLSKIMYSQLQVPTPRWQVYRSAAKAALKPGFEAERYVIKPNNSSASWGIHHSTEWAELQPEVEALLANNHDVIVEEYIPGIDVTVPVVGAGEPWILYPMENGSGQNINIVTYEQKRGFTKGEKIQAFSRRDDFPELIEFTERANQMIWPFDYGRFDYRITPDNKVYALEFNLSCNLGAGRAIAQSAKLLGYEQVDIVESVLANSLERQRNMFELAVQNKSLRWEV